jgi:hypothetical protein
MNGKALEAARARADRNAKPVEERVTDEAADVRAVEVANARAEMVKLFEDKNRQRKITVAAARKQAEED